MYLAFGAFYFVCAVSTGRIMSSDSNFCNIIFVKKKLQKNNFYDKRYKKDAKALSNYV